MMLSKVDLIGHLGHLGTLLGTDGTLGRVCVLFLQIADKPTPLPPPVLEVFKRMKIINLAIASVNEELSTADI